MTRELGVNGTPPHIVCNCQATPDRAIRANPNKDETFLQNS